MARASNNIIRFPKETVADIEAVAAAWVARTTSGSLTLAELAELELWRAASKEHDRAYLALEATWERMGAVLAARQAPPRVEPRLPEPVPRVRRPGASGSRGFVAHLLGGTGSLGRLGRMAAAIAVVALTFQYVSVWRYDYHTAPGEIRQVRLADGSVMHLKGGTTLDVRISSTGPRVVELARGEAFFEVAHDASRPFTVVVGASEVRDIGTGFLVSRHGQAGVVAVEHGIVEVAAGGRTDTLHAGEQVSFSAYDLKRKLRVDTATIAPWRRGLYVAENKPLGEVLDDLQAYYDHRIIVTSRALKARRVNAVVQLDHVGAWFDALDDTKDVSVRRWGPLAIVGDRPD